MSTIASAGTVTVPETGHGCLVFRGSQLLLTDAGAVADDIVRAVDELEDVRFFDVDALPAVLPMKYTMASLLLEDFRARHRRR